MVNAKKMEKLPEGWNLVKLGEVGKIFYGKRLSEVDYDEYGESKVYGTSGVLARSHKFIDIGEALIIPRKGTINNKFYVGKDEKFWVIDTAFYLKTDINTKYLFYKLETIDLNILNEATGVPSLNKNTLKQIKILYPPLLEQRKIAEILETVDNSIEKTDKIIEKYKRIKQGLMQVLLTKGIVESDELGVMSYESRNKSDELGVRNYELKNEIREELGVKSFELADKKWEIRSEKKHKFKDSPLGRIPEEWEVVELGEVGSIITGSTPSTKKQEYYGDDYQFISPEDINEEKYITKTQKMLSGSGFKISRQIPSQSICVVCIGSTIGKVAITVEKCTTNQQINTIVPDNDKYFPEALYYFVLYYVQNPLRKEAGLQAVPIVNKSKFSKVKIPLPPFSEQRRIAFVLSQIDRIIEREQRYKAKLERIKQGLMEDLLTGKIRVNHLIEGDGNND